MRCGHDGLDGTDEERESEGVKIISLKTSFEETYVSMKQPDAQCCSFRTRANSAPNFGKTSCLPPS